MMASVNNVLGTWLTTSDCIEKYLLVNDSWLSDDKKSYREVASSDKTATDKFVISFAKILEEQEYLPQQIYNCDNTLLFW